MGVAWGDDDGVGSIEASAADAFLGTLVAALLIMGSYRGWFGEYLQSIVLPIVEAARTLQRLHGAELDQWWKLIGGTISILSGCWFIYKSWSFAEHRMLFRIQQFLSRQDERLLHVRDGLIEVINGRRSVATTRMPLCTAKELGIALNDLKFGRVDQAHLALDKSIKSLKDQMAAWESQKGFLNRQLSASHLLRGVMLASPSGAGDASARRLRALEAEKHFDLAVSLHDNDPQALVYRPASECDVDERGFVWKTWFGCIFQVDRIEGALNLSCQDRSSKYQCSPYTSGSKKF